MTHPPTEVLARLLLDLHADIPGLLDRHQPDSDGCCRGCALPQAGQTRWPCTLHAAADTAQQLLRRRARA